MKYRKKSHSSASCSKLSTMVRRRSTTLTWFFLIFLSLIAFGIFVPVFALLPPLSSHSPHQQQLQHHPSTKRVSLFKIFWYFMKVGKLSRNRFWVCLIFGLKGKCIWSLNRLTIQAHVCPIGLNFFHLKFWNYKYDFWDWDFTFWTVFQLPNRGMIIRISWLYA